MRKASPIRSTRQISGIGRENSRAVICERSTSWTLVKKNACITIVIASKAKMDNIVGIHMSKCVRSGLHASASGSLVIHRAAKDVPGSDLAGEWRIWCTQTQSAYKFILAIATVCNNNVVLNWPNVVFLWCGVDGGNMGRTGKRIWRSRKAEKEPSMKPAVIDHPSVGDLPWNSPEVPLSGTLVVRLLVCEHAVLEPTPSKPGRASRKWCAGWRYQGRYHHRTASRSRSRLRSHPIRFFPRVAA